MDYKAILSVSFLEDGDPDAKIQAWMLKNEGIMPCLRGCTDSYFAPIWRTLSQDTRNMMWERAKKICKVKSNHPISFIGTLNVMLQDATINVYTPEPVTRMTLAQKRKALRTETNQDVLTKFIAEEDCHDSLRLAAIKRLGETVSGLEWLLNYACDKYLNYTELISVADSLTYWWQTDAQRVTPMLAAIDTDTYISNNRAANIIGRLIGRLPTDSADAFLDALPRKTRNELARDVWGDLYRPNREEEYRPFVDALNRMRARWAQKRGPHVKALRTKATP